MIKMKIAIVLTICLTANSFLFAQQSNDMLSKEEMNKEFDYLIELVSEINPHLPIYKQMMGYDVIKEMKKQRKKINEIENWGQYYKFLSSIVGKIPEDHTRILLKSNNDYYVSKYPHLSDSVAKSNVKKVMRDFDLNPDMSDKMDIIISNYNINLAYINGRWYNLHGVKIIDQQAGIEQYIRSGWELVKVNHVPILKFIKRNKSEYVGHNRFDVENQLFYNLYPLDVSSLYDIDMHSKKIIRNDLILTFLNPACEEVPVKYAAKDAKSQPHHVFEEFAEETWHWIRDYEKQRNKVICFDSILYVKILSMNMNDLNYFKGEISKYRDTILKKVVIDIRDNKGGNDLLWHGVLGMIIDTTLMCRGKIVISDNEIYRHEPYLTNIPFDSLEMYKDVILDREFRLLNYNYGIHPDRESLNYEGDIYLLHNRGSFSSSISFLSFALGEERLVAVGEHNGSIGGYGVTPLVLQLPYSKLSFIMHSSLHIPDNAKSVEDYFWNKTEVEVTTTPEWEVLMYLNKDFFTPEILKTKDPFFRKVMELK